MTAVLKGTKEEQEPTKKPTKTPCLGFNKAKNTTLKVLEHALVNATLNESDILLEVCATFPSRRAIFVLEIVSKSAGVITAKHVEFYEFTPESGWRFKKHYKVVIQ